MRRRCELQHGLSSFSVFTVVWVAYGIHISSHRSGENDVDFIGNLETEEGELLDDLAGATGKSNIPPT